ncbi:hypothetical protein PABG_06055 [Paracoccidioides brasiliensis Pb03]|nr:hypothetical protein PABG_06055 [Paracoccidioides brasiliensis Pb03]
MQVILAASICTRGGKAVLSRQFREISRSRIEALLASFPKLADSGTQHTIVEQDNVRFVYQPLDELYIVLITNKQSNILQDIDSLHIFAQVVTSICKSLDEREILRNSFELLSAFDELVTLGYRENLSLSQIKTFLEMESHEERVQEIIERNKELEATEERKRKAKQLELQRKEAARSGRGVTPRAPSYPVYSPPTRPTPTEAINSYEAEKKKTFGKPMALRGKGMQLGKKSKATDMYEKVRGDLGPESEEIPLVSTATAPAHSDAVAQSRASVSADREPIHVTVAETISAKLSRDGAVKSYEIKGDLQLRITDDTFAKVKLGLTANPTHEAVFRTHPNVDRALFTNSKTIQLRDTSKSFPHNISIGVLRWRVTGTDSPDVLPITFTVWVNRGAQSSTVTIEYELNGSDPLRDVVVSIPFGTVEPTVTNFDAIYEVTGDSLDWNIGTVDESNPSGSFEFESEDPNSDENEFFPMSVRFQKTTPFVDVDVQTVSLLEMDGQTVNFSKDFKTIADGYVVE